MMNFKREYDKRYKKLGKKQTVVEAIQFHEENRDDVYDFITCEKHIGKAIDNHSTIVMKTAKGNVVVCVGDWITKSVEFSSLKPDIFEKKYKKMEL